MRFDAVQTIKDRLTMREVLLHYGYQPNRANFICCPFHNEKTPSMKIYEKDYHCFGCGAHGDIIFFVQSLFNLSFPDTLKKIDVDFNLNIYSNHTFEELRRSHYKQKQIQAERKRIHQQKKKINDEYWKAFDEWCRLEKNKIDYAPKTTNEEFHPLYVEALHKLEHQIFELEILEERRKNLE